VGCTHIDASFDTELISKLFANHPLQAGPGGPVTTEELALILALFLVGANYYSGDDALVVGREGACVEIAHYWLKCVGVGVISINQVSR